MKLAELKQSSARHILLYGSPKSGKTTAYGQLAKKFDLHVFDMEDSTKTLMSLPPALMERINVTRIPDTSENSLAFQTMMKLFKAKKGKICHAHGKYACSDKECATAFDDIDFRTFTDLKRYIVVMESYSQLVESTMNFIMSKAIAAGDWDAKAGWDEYGKQGRVLDFFGNFIQTCPFNIIVVSHETMVKLPDGSEKLVPIGGTSNASKTFAKFFDDVVYCQIKNGKHRMISSTTGVNGILAGSRTNKVISESGGLLELFE